MKVQINSRLDEELKKELAKGAKRCGLSIEVIVRSALLDFAGMSSEITSAHARLFRAAINPKTFKTE